MNISSHCTINHSEEKDVPRILVVGRNSKVWSLIKETEIIKNNIYRIVSVSSREVYELSCNLLFDRFDYVVILSYSMDEKENRKLLHNARFFSPRLIYISTCSVKAYDMGYHYKYPKVKRLAENYARNSNIFDRVVVIRLGILKGTIIERNMRGRYKVTSPEELASAICFPSCRGSYFEINNLYKDSEREFSNKKERIFFSVYRRIILFHPFMMFVMRPLDLLLRKLSWNWYGYNCVVNYG